MTHVCPVCGSDDLRFVGVVFGKLTSFMGACGHSGDLTDDDQWKIRPNAFDSNNSRQRLLTTAKAILKNQKPQR